MRAQCCICADLFVHDDDKDIAATPCGHVFHEQCLAQWLASSSTCPSCRMHLARASVIPKLYFDLGDEAKEEIDSDKLSNELQALRAKLSKVKHKKAKTKELINDLKEKLKNKEEETETLGLVLKREQDVVATQQRMLQQYELQQQAVMTERSELKKMQRKVSELQQVEVLIKGAESEAEAILQQNSEGDRACLQQLARYCAVLKREYEQAKTEKKSLKEQVEKYRQTNFTISRELTTIKGEVNLLRDQLSRSEDDLKHAEKANTHLKTKLNRMKLSKKHPAETSGSFLDTPELKDSSVEIFTETPKLDRVDGNCADGLSTPKMTKPSDSNFINLTLNPPEILTPDLFDDSPVTKVKKTRDENRKVVKVSCAHVSKAPKRVCLEADQIVDALPLSVLNIMKKRQTAGQLLGSTVVRKDYNGLGGTSTFTQPLGPPKFANFKLTSKAMKRAKPVNKGLHTKPPLPTLDNFIDLT